MTDRLRGRRLQERRSLYFAHNPLCKHCQDAGRITVATELDHIKALDNGGEDDDPNNWQGLCSDCHKTKTAKDMGYTPKQTIGIDGWPVGGVSEVNTRKLETSR